MEEERLEERMRLTGNARRLGHVGFASLGTCPPFLKSYYLTPASVTNGESIQPQHSPERCVAAKYRTS